MRLNALTPLVLLAGLPAISIAATVAPGEGELTPDQTVQALIEEFDTAQQEFFEVYRTAETEEERSKLVAEKYPRPEQYVARFWELADAYANQPAEMTSLVWIVGASRGDDQDRALDRLRTNHVQAENLDEACSALDAYTNSEAAVAFLRAVLNENPHKQAKGMACYSLAQVLWGKADREGAEGTTWAVEAEELLTKVIRDFADVGHASGPLAEVAEGDLFELRNLAVGKEAPDIAAEDLDGVAFQLSDYRGKVVVLDFWGNW